MLYLIWHPLILFFFYWVAPWYEAKQTGGIIWLENYLSWYQLSSPAPTRNSVEVFEIWIPTQDSIKILEQMTGKEHGLYCFLSVVACSSTALCTNSYCWVEIHQRRETVACKVTLPTYLEVLDEFLDLPVFRRQVCVTVRTALWLLLLLLTLGWTLAEGVHRQGYRWGLTEPKKRADNSALLTADNNLQKVWDSGISRQYKARQRDGI